MRRCGWCQQSLEGRREDARYCDDRCRAKAWKRRNGSTIGSTTRVTVRTATGEPQTPSSPRRSTRNGRGAHIYFTPSDLQDLALHLPHLSLPVAEKVKAARRRIDAASEH